MTSAAVRRRATFFFLTHVAFFLGAFAPPLANLSFV
jgi:hypothetical protein